MFGRDGSSTSTLDEAVCVCVWGGSGQPGQGSLKGANHWKNFWWSYHMFKCEVFDITPFPQIDIIGAVLIVWRVKGKIIRSVLCNTLRNNCAQCNKHTYERT